MTTDHPNPSPASPPTPGSETPAIPPVSGPAAPAATTGPESKATPETTPVTAAPGEAVPAQTQAEPAPAAAAPEIAPSPASSSKFALVVDDEPANRDFLVRLLEQAQLDVKGAVDGADALNKLANIADVRLIAIDHKLPDMEGVDLLAQLRPRFPNARLIMATMHDDRALMEKAFSHGCDVFLVKPHGFMELFRRVQLLDSHEDGMNKLIIDQYGPRPYRG